MPDQSGDIERDLDILEAELKRLEAEYTMYFAGRRKRPPVETQKRVAGLVKTLDRRHFANYGAKFKFSTLQTRFTKLNDLWDRALRAREEGRPGPFALPRAAGADEPSTVPAAERVVHVATFTDPLQETDKLQQLYESVAEARRTAGQDAIPFHRFADLVAGQVSQMREKGRAEVAFRVKVKDGKVSLTAKGLKERPGG